MKPILLLLSALLLGNIACQEQTDPSELSQLQEIQKFYAQINTNQLYEMRNDIAERGDRASDVQLWHQLTSILQIDSKLKLSSNYADQQDSDSLNQYLDTLLKEADSYDWYEYNKLTSAIDHLKKARARDNKNPDENSYRQMMIGIYMLHGAFIHDHRIQIGSHGYDAALARLFIDSDTLVVNQPTNAIITINENLQWNQGIEISNLTAELKQAQGEKVNIQVTPVGQGAWLLEFTPQVSGKYKLDFLAHLRSKVYSTDWTYPVFVQKNLIVN